MMMDGTVYTAVARPAVPIVIPNSRATCTSTGARATVENR